MDWNEIVSMIMEDVVRPALLLIIPALGLIIKSYVDKITVSIIKKNEAEILCSQTTVQKNFMQDLEKIVEAAVCINMDLAEELKKANPEGKLPAQTVEMLQNSVKGNIYTTIEPMLASGELSGMIGGSAAVRNIIDGLIEKYVTDQKTRRNDSRM